MAFLPSGNILITQNTGEMRVVNPKKNFISAPLAGVPPVKVTGAQGLHDLLLDPDFARNRLVYFTYFAPPKGEAPGIWPIEHYYEDVWTKPFTERRTMRVGTERIARARLSDDERSLENVDVLAEGVERRIVLARDGTLLVTGADRFRFYDSELDGVEHDFSDNPDIRRNFSGRVIRINRDGSIRILDDDSHFYAHLTASPDGSHLAWVCWEHPDMPWDATELRVATITDGSSNTIAFGEASSTPTQVFVTLAPFQTLTPTRAVATR